MSHASISRRDLLLVLIGVSEDGSVSGVVNGITRLQKLLFLEVVAAALLVEDGLAGLGPEPYRSSADRPEVHQAADRLSEGVDVLGGELDAGLELGALRPNPGGFANRGLVVAVSPENRTATSEERVCVPTRYLDRVVVPVYSPG